MWLLAPHQSVPPIATSAPWRVPAGCDCLLSFKIMTQLKGCGSLTHSFEVAVNRWFKAVAAFLVQFYGCCSLVAIRAPTIW